MNSLIYLGETPSDRQSVSETLTARGINYLRSEPSKLVAIVHSDFSLPPYDIYKNNLHAYIRAAHTKSPVLLNNPYMPIETTFTLSIMPGKIPVIFSFNSKLRDETRDHLKSTFRLDDTLARGKPAFTGELTFEEIRTVVKDFNPTLTTPSTNTHMNLIAAKSFRVIHRIAAAFYRLQQYPSHKDGEVTDYMRNAVDVAIPVDDKEDVDMTTDSEEQHWVTYMLARETRYMAHANLPVPYETYKPEIATSSQIPTGSGFCLPYVRELSLPDYKTIPSVIGRYFVGLLGENAEEAQETYEEIKSAWGVICRLELGFELAHIYWCIALAIETRSQILAVVPSSGKYAGSMIMGEGFKIDLRNRLIEPCVRSDLVEGFNSMNPHDEALAKIYWLLAYATGEARIQDRDACRSFHQLRLDIQNHPQRVDKTNELEKLAMQLTFPGAEPLAATAHNVALVMAAISNEGADETKFPLYPRCVVESERDARLLSAFGAYAPSFLVPGGKLMMLDKPFEVAVGKKSEGNSRNVTKIGYIMKPLDTAVADLRKVKEIKGVHNPHGTAVMGRTSSNSLIRTADTENASGIVYALRMYSGTALSDVILGKKRAREPEGETGAGSKKKKVIDW
ncbi:TPA_asm: hypothetical protein [Armillaria mellea ambi-like virus 2]|uniref:Uncharacterized protein n=1 Tax=Armillaria mellea ambi-like virus 2 TaxID=2803969 RepID=A0A8D9PD19_9VIRU|nr:TPA_asm: hypothetical protein [Armillaria mellea ambi-like virus 2]